MYRYIFNKIKPIIPRISNTEMIALRSGGVAVDRDIFSGKLDLTALKQKTILDVDKELVDYTTVNVIKKVDEIKKYSDYDMDYHKKVMEVLGENKFLGFIIDQQYGGNKKSIVTQGKVLTKLASNNPSLGICAMVPNSLGPGELLLHYGTEQQKEKYLEGLTTGKYIPCFGLTGPNNGSDATGSIDSGIVKLDTNGTKYIDVKINKRYITLAPIANLVGVAFKLEDPDNLLEEGSEGVTLALLERGHIGLEQSTYHKPMNVDFPNGTLKGHLKIPMDKVIGGEKMTGSGWKMLMECLSVGRAVSLPCSANGGNMASTVGIYHYINHRKQFNIPIVRMEGVKSKFTEMLMNTWLINANIHYTNHMLDNGMKPAVISAIMKQQSTDRARVVLNHAMDIHAGSAICFGDNNFLSKYYMSSPIGITVEGSNTLTRNLMIFGQGLNNAHPHIFDLFNCFMEDDINSFKNHFNKMMGHVGINYMKSVFSMKSSDEISNLESNIVRFANLANFVALMGGKIKSKQMISGMMADILSCLYLGHGLIWYNSMHNNKYDIITEHCLKMLNIEAESKINTMVDNYPNILKHMLKPCKASVRNVCLEDSNKLYDSLMNTDVMKHIDNMIYYSDDSVIGKMSKLSQMDRDSKEYEDLYQDIIGVGEYSIKKSPEKINEDIKSILV